MMISTAAGGEATTQLLGIEEAGQGLALINRLTEGNKQPSGPDCPTGARPWAGMGNWGEWQQPTSHGIQAGVCNRLPATWK